MDIAPRPLSVAFLLVPGFALLSYSAAMEPLRAANVLSNRELYRWRHLTPTGAPAAASNGIAFAVDGALDGGDAAIDILLVCAGGNPAEVEDDRLFSSLRRLARFGVTIGGISGGPFLLARAGLLNDRRCTVHWEHVAAFEESFPRARLTRSLFEIDGDRITCAGAIAALDMMCAVIGRDHGAALGAAVSDWFLHSYVRSGVEPGRMDLRYRTGVTDPRLIAAMKAMEANIETPLSRAELARIAQLSLRHLERAFSDQLGHGIHTHYLGVRLARARQLLQESGMSVSAVGVACGFNSAAQFSRAFAKRFGQAPQTLTRRQRATARLRTPPHRSG